MIEPDVNAVIGVIGAVSSTPIRDIIIQSRYEIRAVGHEKRVCLIIHLEGDDQAAARISEALKSVFPSLDVEVTGDG